MTTRVVQIICSKEESDKIKHAISDKDILNYWEVADISQDNVVFSILLTLENSQTLLDSLQSKIDAKTIKKVIVSSVEAILPQEKKTPPPPKPSRFRITDEAQRVPREELYNQVSNDAELNTDYVFLILLSTIVAALGLLHNQVIAVIAAMMIAPMLEPNLAIAFSVVMGDIPLFIKASKTTLLGIGICLLFSIIIGLLWPNQGENSAFFLMHANVGYTSIILALASGTAGAISLTSRLSKILVGVIMAVALLPPLVTTGILIGSHNFFPAIGAGLLFIINIVCVNISANLVFLYKGIHPRKWYEKEKAKKAIFWYLLSWVCLLLALCIAIFYLG